MSVSSRSARLAALALGVVLSSEPSSLPCLPLQLKGEVCVWVLQFVCVCVVSVLQGCSPRGGRAAMLLMLIVADNSRRQDPVCGLPLSGTSCVGLQPPLPLLHPPFPGTSPALLCTLLGSYNGALFHPHQNLILLVHPSASYF